MTVPPLSDPSLWVPELSHQLCPWVYGVWQHLFQSVSARGCRLLGSSCPALGGGSRLCRTVPRSFRLKLVWAGLFPPSTGIPLWSSHGPASQKGISADIQTRKVQSIPQSAMIPARERILGTSLPALFRGAASGRQEVTPSRSWRPASVRFYRRGSGPRPSLQAGQKER